ncbi:hypothetical protein OKA04_03705 [Luteolibacter flavescens]|uniref:Transmembrane protein n=1 Tax=Luteolibacter flavescens TaxID=1859460 RepID=A0ABT3FKV5_9BACT|nr:hypothetical protein [Luteolibacter flavescens]MCW1883819.1 hypothetical protein [Luteolibacter flavescens]
MSRVEGLEKNMRPFPLLALWTAFEVVGGIFSIMGCIAFLMAFGNLVWSYLQPQYRAIEALIAQSGEPRNPRVVLLSELFFNSLIAGAFTVLVGLAFPPAAPLAFAGGLEFQFRKMRRKSGTEVQPIQWRYPLVKAIIQVACGIAFFALALLFIEGLR